MLGEIHRPPRLPASALAAALEQSQTVVDTRTPPAYAEGAVPGTINIPAGRAFTTWAGSLVPYDRDLNLIVDDPGAELIEELARDLAGIGLDRIAGYFGMDVLDAWRTSHGELQRIPSLTLPQFTGKLGNDDTVVLDVREESEWKAGHIPHSRNIPVRRLEERLEDLPERATLVIHCQTGSRAAIAASLLRARGFSDVCLFPSGFAGWRAAGQPVERQ
jgi:hydroxyacylglutathione hydrolase